MRRYFKSHGAASVVVLGTALVILNFLHLADLYAVNLFVQDQWDLYGPILFRPASTWQLFHLQFGPHREGLGMIFSRLIGQLSNYNTRAEIFSQVGVLILALFCALALKKRLFGKISYSDILIAPIVLTLNQFDVVASIPEPAHSVIPLLLLLLYCLVYLLERTYLAAGALSLIYFLLLYTGNGFTLCIGLFLVLLVDLVRTFRNERQKTFIPQLLVSTAALISTVSFFLPKYKFASGGDPLAFHPFGYYVSSVSLMMSATLGFFTWRPIGFGPVSPELIAQIVGISALGTLLVIFTRSVVSRDIKMTVDQANVRTVVSLLAGATLGFMVCVAVGRPLEGAQKSQYVTLGVPGLLAIYFFSLQVQSVKTRRIFHSLYILLTLYTCLMPLPSADYALWKQRWKACYLATNDYDGCITSAGPNFDVYPWIADRQKIKQKIEFLRSRHLNLFAD